MADGDRKSPFQLAAKDDLPLKIFYRKDAHKSARAWITRSYVAEADRGQDCSGIVGYISLMCAEVALEGAYAIPEKESVNRYPSQPALRIARLAVCDDAQGRKVGRTLVDFSIGLAITTVAPAFGCRFMIVNSKAKSVGFYESAGFKPLATDENMKSPHPVMFFDLLRQGSKSSA
jgi:GNAT superfamily N-acetyltransferase